MMGRKELNRAAGLDNNPGMCSLRLLVDGDSSIEMGEPKLILTSNLKELRKRRDKQSLAYEMETAFEVIQNNICMPAQLADERVAIPLHIFPHF